MLLSESADFQGVDVLVSVSSAAKRYRNGAGVCPGRACVVS